jgi:hypothetical protein
MIKQIIIVIILGFCVSCSTSNYRTALELENESLKTGVKNDNLGKGYLSGMTREDVYKHSKELELKKEVSLLDDSSIITRFETNNFILTNLTIFYYYDGKLFRKISHVLTDKNESKNDSIADFKKEVLDDTKKNFGNIYYSNGTQKSKFFWLKGNLRIDYFDTLETVFVSCSDMLVEKQMAKKIAFEQQQEEEKAASASKQEEQLIIEKLKAKAK